MPQTAVDERSFVTQFKRVVAIVVWTFVAFWCWLAAVSLGVRFLAYAQARHGWSRPAEWTLPFVLYGVLGLGTLVITVGVLVLGLHGRLPGTRKSRDQPRGFPVEASTPAPSDPPES